MHGHPDLVMNFVPWPPSLSAALLDVRRNFSGPRWPVHHSARPSSAGPPRPCSHQGTRFAGARFPLGEGGSISTGLLYATIGIATGVGPAALQSLLPDTLLGNEQAILWGFLFLFVGSVVLALSVNLGVLLLANFIRSSGSGILWVFSATMLMKSIDPEYRGRVFAYEWAVLTLLGACSKVVLGLGTYAEFSLEALAGATAVLAFAVLIATALLLPRVGAVIRIHLRSLLTRKDSDSNPLPTLPDVELK